MCYDARVRVCRSLEPWGGASLIALSLWLAACSDPLRATGKAGEGDITLRFRPNDAESYREHWIYDVELPGIGIQRNGLSFDVRVARPEQGSLGVHLRHTVRRQYYARDGQPEPGPRLLGAVMNSQWGSDRSLLGELSVEAPRPELAAAARAAFAAARFGMLIEYPDQPVGVSDSWSIEPRSLPVGPSLEATLRPSYTLQAIEQHGDEREARIAADIQVDLLPSSVGEGVTIEGGGTASSTLRVRVSDGLLLDARTVLHFNQEIVVAGSEVLGYREFSASAHMFATPAKEQPNLAAEPLKLEAADADEQRECAALLDSATARVGRAPAQTRLFLVAALHAAMLPTATFGAPLRETGMSLVVAADPKRVELDGTPLDVRDLPRALRTAAAAGTPLYIYCEAALPVERVRTLLALIPRGYSPRLVVRDAEDDTPPPKAPRWLEEQLKLALSAPNHREERLQQLLVDHLALCDGALHAFHRALATGRGFDQLPAEIVSAFVRCGCTTTNLDGLEAILYAMFGSPDLRFLRLPRLIDEHKLPAGASVRELAKLLSANPLPSVPARVD
jgi:hypothetical protein